MMYYSYDDNDEAGSASSSLSQVCRGIRAETCKEHQRYRINRILAGKKLIVCEGTRYIDRNMLRVKEDGKWYGIGFGMFGEARLKPWMGMNSLHLLQTFALSLSYSVNLQSSSTYLFLKRLSKELKQVKRIRIPSFYHYGSWVPEMLENCPVRSCFDVLILFLTLPTVTEVFINSLAPWTSEVNVWELKQVQLLLDRLGIRYIGEEHEMGYLLKYT
jgi:hypothetical protein